MDKALVYNTENGRILKSYKSFGWAARGAVKMHGEARERGNECFAKAATTEDYQLTGAITANEKVVVYSIFDMKQERPIEIPRAQVGTVCDPSMEAYHTM